MDYFIVAGGLSAGPASEVRRPNKFDAFQDSGWECLLPPGPVLQPGLPISILVGSEYLRTRWGIDDSQYAGKQVYIARISADASKTCLHARYFQIPPLNYGDQIISSS